MTGRQQLLAACRARFGFLDRMSLSLRETQPQSVPGALDLLLCLLEADNLRRLCIVLPSRGDLPRMAAVLHALCRFRRHYDERLKRIAEKEIPPGSLVRVRPQGSVFRYLGIWAEFPEFFKLQTLPRRKGHAPGERSLPLTELLRLEPTTQESPKGGAESFSVVPPTALDQLLNVTTYGNQSLFSTEVLLLDGKERFSDFGDRTRLRVARAGSAAAAPLASIVPCGSIHNGSAAPYAVRDGEDLSAGSPLVAVTHSIDTLAEYCAATEHDTPLVVINGASRITNVQAFDDISEVRRVVVFSDHQEEEQVADLVNRGCKLWTLGSQDLIGTRSPLPRDSHSVFGCVMQRASNADRLQFSWRECRCEAIEAAAQHLAPLRPDRDADPQAAIARTVRSAWGLVLRVAGVVGALDEEDAAVLNARISDAANRLRRDAAWIPGETRELFETIYERLRAACHVGSGLGAEKMRALESLRTEGPEAGTLLICRPDQEESLARYISTAQWQTWSVCTPATIPPDRLFDRIIFTSWVNSAETKRISSAYSTPSVILVGYPFELCWMQQFARRWRRAPRAAEISDSEKQKTVARITGVEFEWETPTPGPDDGRSTGVPWPSAESIEQFVRSVRKGTPALSPQTPDAIAARYVGFVGNAYAYLTATHRVPVATQLVRDHAHGAREITERVVDQLRPGDFIVFPDNGDVEILRDLADRMLGTKAPRLRELAGQWRTSLKASGLTPLEFQSRAAGLQESRHILTIRNWFSDSPQIGPRSRDDLTLIALVVEDEELDGASEEIWAAIEQLRGAHVRAGAHLRDVLMQKLPDVLRNVVEHGTRVELEDVGAAWVVQVEALSGSAESRARSEINRLLWDDPA